MPQTPNVKKFLDAGGLAYFASLLNNYPTNNVLQVVIDAIDQVKADKTDIVNSDWNATSGTAEILNKPTIPNVPAWALESTKPTYTASEVGATTTSDVNGLIASAIGDINSFDVAIVSTLPATDISTHTIYFMANSASGSNVYDEYMYINGNWELLGSTTIDLSNYLQKTDIADWAKAASKPTYTATEVGALPDTTVIPAAQVNADWNATSGVAQILNKPTIPAATTVTQALTSGTLIATINGTNIYAPSYTDADGVSY